MRSIAELNELAQVKLDPEHIYPIRRYASTTVPLLAQGKKHFEAGEYEDAYIFYMRVCRYSVLTNCSIALDLLPKHPHFSHNHLRNPEYVQIYEAAHKALERCEILRGKLEALAKLSMPSPPTSGIRKPSLKTRIMQELNVVQQQMEMPEIPEMPEMPLESLKSSTALAVSNQPNAPEEADVVDMDPLKGWSNDFVSPTILLGLLTKRGKRPSILVLDLRDRSDFRDCHIKAPDIVNLEPIILQRGPTAASIEEALILSPHNAEKRFAERDKFELVVYYDETSKITDYSPIKALLKALETDAKELKRKPVCMSGGFQAWRQMNGIEWCMAGEEDNEVPMLPESEEKDGEWVAKLRRSSAVKKPQGEVGEKELLAGSAIGNAMAKRVSAYNYFSPIEEESEPKPTSPETIRRIEQVTKIMDGSKKPDKLVKGLRRQGTIFDNPYMGFTSVSAKDKASPRTPVLHKRSSVRESIVNVRKSVIRPEATNAQLREKLLQQIQKRPDQEYQGPKEHNLPIFPARVSMIGSETPGACGLKNLGNTCFMNSILQCLCGTLPLARFFIDGSYKRSLNRDNIMGTKGEVADAFATLMRSMTSGQFPVLSPKNFKEVVGKHATQFKGCEQQDSQEFLGFLLDSLHEDLKLLKKPIPPELEYPDEEFEKLPPQYASDVSWTIHLLRNSSYIVSIFHGQYRSQLRCLTCNQTSTTYNPFMYLSLPIPTGTWKSTVPLKRCIDGFLRGEILEGDNCWNCPRCKVPRRASKQLELTRLPDLLLIHLKRFSFQGPFRSKLENKVDYPVHSLSMEPYVPGGGVYDLYAVSNHYGGLNGGHYTACVRSPYRGEWHNFDDNRVSLVDEGFVKSKAAYVLFYVRAAINR